jgi:glycosyltransferase involved in cell wall biosynthesis
MRILIAAPAPREREGGVANVVYNTAESLRRLGHEVTCMFNEDILQTPVAIPRFEMVYFAFSLVGQLWSRRNEFDVVNIHAPAGFAYGLVRRLRPNSGLPPYVMLLHGIEERRNYAMSREAKKGRAWHFSWKNRIWQYAYHMNLYRWAIVTADYSVVINQETWSVLEVKYRRPVGSVKYIPNGVEPRFFLEREYREDNALRLLFVGTWLDHKGIYYLRDGFEELAAFPRYTIDDCGLQNECGQRERLVFRVSARSC